MRYLEVAARSFLLSLLLLNSEDGGAQESSQDELRKHNEDELMRKEMQSTVYGCGLESSSYSGAHTRRIEETKEIRYTRGRLCKAWEILPSSHRTRDVIARWNSRYETLVKQRCLNMIGRRYEKAWHEACPTCFAALAPANWRR
jgi:hypothetical protein